MHINNNTNQDSILLIHHGKGIGGAAKSLSMLANRMDKEGFKIKVLFLYSTDAIKLFKSHYHVVGLPFLYFNHSSRWYGLRQVHIIVFQIISWFITLFIIAPYWYLKLKPDIIYLNSSSLTSWAFTAKILGIRNVIHIRESISKGYFGIRKELIRRLINFSADKVLLLSNQNYNRIKTLLNKSVIIPNYVFPNQAITNIDKVRKYDFIYVGGNDRIKGYANILELLKIDLSSRYCLIGYYDQEFYEMFNKRENITIVGVVSDALNYIKMSRFLLFPATTPHFPRPVIEAMSCGTIPISSELEGINEIIKNNYDGFFISGNNLLAEISFIKNNILKDEYNIRKNCFRKYQKLYSSKNEDKIIYEIVNL